MKKITIKSYILGFVLSLILTLSAYFITSMHINSDFGVISQQILIPIIIGIAILQLIVQLIFFLHLTHESKPRWNLVFFVSTIGIILIVIVGSIWIINHLNYNMNPQQVDQYIQSQDGF
jgi:cytochrome o ubiquinol oxidase subunit IV